LRNCPAEISLVLVGPDETEREVAERGLTCSLFGEDFSSSCRTFTEKIMQLKCC
jgi:hypothetical protein